MVNYRVVGVTNRRRDRRIELPPIQIVLEGVPYTTINWSLGGFLVAPYEGGCRFGDEVRVEIVIEFEGRTFRHEAIVEIVRIARGSKELAAQFTSIEPAAVETLEAWMTGRLRRLERQRRSA